MKNIMKFQKDSLRNDVASVPKTIRVSIGSAIVLELLKGKLDAEPTTAYLMTYRKGKCSANCGFCPQARESHGGADMLSRVSWPLFPTESVLDGIERAVGEGKVKRVCLQALNYQDVFKHLAGLVDAIHRRANVPISVSCQPLNNDNIRLLAEAGVERIGIPLDAATEELFDKVKCSSAGGPYSWKKQFELLDQAVKIFGRGGVSTHLIVGLGETEKEMVKLVQRCVDMGVLPALFAFTPILGTALEHRPQPSIQKYRRIQIARHLIVHEMARCESMRFDGEGCLSDFGMDKRTLFKVIRTGEPFLTSGCPDCNRPYYNEKPSGPMYNYPRSLAEKEFPLVLHELDMDGA
jgi:biotin synthase-related radical SAM superfamily protein